MAISEKVISTIESIIDSIKTKKIIAEEKNLGELDETKELEWVNIPLEYLKNIKGIGDKAIDSLRKAHFKDVQEIYDISKENPKKLMELEGIGKKTAEILWENIEKSVLKKEELLKPEEKQILQKSEIIIKEKIKKEEILQKKDLIKAFQDIKLIDLNLKNNLNDEQFKVIDDMIKLGGNMLVLAGAGSGKTRTISYAVGRLLKEGINPKKIMLITFSKKASIEMIDRVQKLLGSISNMPYLSSLASLIRAGTFHSIANTPFCRNFSQKLSYSKYYDIMDASEARYFLTTNRNKIIDNKLYQWKNITYGKTGKAPSSLWFEKKEEIANSFPRVSEIQSIFSGSMNWERSVSEMIQWKYPEYNDYISDIVNLHQEYTKKKKWEKKRDFDDLLLDWYNLLNQYNDVKQFTQQFQYFLIDEYQDTNIIQNKIVKILSELPTTKLVLAVGDDAQSIYAFRGANFENVLEFKKNFKNARIYEITTNYRSVPEILELANGTIANNKNQHPKSMKPFHKTYKKPKVIQSSSWEEQIDYIVKEISNLNRNEKISYKEMAILIRSIRAKSLQESKIMEYLEELLIKSGIPYEIRGGINFFHKAHIQDIMAIFGYLHKQKGSISQGQFMRISERYITGFGKTGASNLHWHILNKEKNALDLLTNELQLKSIIEKHNLSMNIKANIRIQDIGISNLIKFFNMVTNLKGKTFGDQIEALFKDNDFLKSFNNLYSGESFDKRMRDINNLINSAKNYKSYRRFNEERILGREEDIDGEADQLIISTTHQAKGLEWNTVFMPFVENNLIPSWFALRPEAKPEDLEEERRVFYVAVTRAKKRLNFFYTSDLSMFITELDQNLYETITI